MIRTVLAIGAASLLAGCVTTNVTEPERYDPQGKCDASGVQARLGAKATAEMGAELLTSSGAQRLRWVPPRTAVTMDFQPNRLNVEYDDAMTITRINSG